MTQDRTRLAASLRGISGILVTPFDRDGKPNPAALEPIVARAAKAGVHGLTVNGNTSEFYSLSFAEAERMQAEVPALVAGRATIIAGVGRSVGEAEQLARVARKAGADALMVHQPPDPFNAPRGVKAYLQRVAEAGELPVILYLRNDAMGIDRIVELASLPGIAGVKWATPNVLLLAEAVRRTRGMPINWVCGLAEPWAPPMQAVGARGFTSGLINVLPERSVAILNALNARDFDSAAEQIHAIGPFEVLRAQENGGANVSVVKAALNLMGEDVGPARPPAAWPLLPEAQTTLEKLLAGWGIATRRAA
ncbi:dihydrodipicolinate synthase family protein [Roseomonas sp. OT10]|uniref:dihydrodipicolinate synthase family protein n=1 Tax=Roseomonas cutis TaxID=2897332 RepID=UPI001E47CDEB|nr:dihydrodipicolinate synthase family protein [Roseomonas sp. OT10]UFN49466.1 dihydrodipicolinate synthase family protein [Roseomonas sp. OT10]